MIPDRKTLSDEEFAEQLMRPHASDRAGDADVARMAEALAVYRQDALQWAERRSAVQPSLAPAARRGDRWAALPRWALATVALVTIAGAAAHVATDRLRVDDAPALAIVRVAEAAATPAELAADDHLLSSIDAALSVHGASPVDGLHLRAGRPLLSGAAE